MQNKQRIRRMTELAALMAVIIVMTLTPLGYLTTPWGMSITLIVIPVSVGAVVLGPGAGAFLGLVFGLTSFFKTLGGGAGVALLMLDASPIRFFMLCTAPRILEGWLTGLIHSGLTRFPKLYTFRIGLCTFLTPIFNTALYMTACWLLFADTWLGYTGYSGGTGFSLLLFMLGIVAVNGIVEAAACFAAGTPIARALIKIH